LPGAADSETSPVRDMSETQPVRGEFELIDRYFTRPLPAGSIHVRLGVGDDCALLAAAAGEEWAVSTDMMVEGVHFLRDVDPAALGHKSLAVNLSDLAACGATPRCYFLAIALPRIDEGWLAEFVRGQNLLADSHHCVLAGGDTTRSPSGVTITITVMGTAPQGQALLRSGARPGDEVWVSGTLGDAALGLACRRGEVELSGPDTDRMIARLERPLPRLALGEGLRGIATSAIDVSDGLVGDLGHILSRSAVGAIIEWPKVPIADALRSLPDDVQLRLALAGGDDYELLFTAPPERHRDVLAAGAAIGVTCIGTIRPTGGLVVVDGHGRPVDTGAAFDHFRQ
jgi:thiamine-monophosphate kinase